MSMSKRRRVHYDYRNQCWVRPAAKSGLNASETGYVVDVCGHPEKLAGCYACQHAGESHTCTPDCGRL